MPGGGDRIALDTSAAIPLRHLSHPDHDAVRRALGRRVRVLTGHSLAETYSILTRAPLGLRLAAADAASVLEVEFGEPVCLEPRAAAAVPRRLADRGVGGGGGV